MRSVKKCVNNVNDTYKVNYKSFLHIHTHTHTHTEHVFILINFWCEIRYSTIPALPTPPPPPKHGLNEE
jgi:hypothetical protein